MQILGDEDRDLAGMSDEELDAAWELWFRLMQSTNDADPLYTHGVFAYLSAEDLGLAPSPGERSSAVSSGG